MWTKSQFKEQFGTYFNKASCCAAMMNGDTGAQKMTKICGAFIDESETVGCYLEGEHSGEIRISYVLFLR